MLVTLLLAAGLADPRAYAKPNLIIEPSQLKSLLDEGRVIVLDVRSKAAYNKAHIKNARWVDAPAWTKAIVANEDIDKWVDRVGALGIDGTSPVVVYDDDLSLSAARVWWMLRHLGLDDVRILNGGWKGWLESGEKPDTAAPAVASKSPKLKKMTDRLASKGDVLEQIKAGKLHQIIDARSRDEHCAVRPTAKRNGAMPGAKHLEWSDTLDAKTGRFKTAPELKKLMEDAGIDPEKPTTCYCQSGGRASVMAFVFELMSGKPARNYYRSWSEWGNDPDTPIVTPKK